MPARKLLVSTYLQYILLALGVVLLFSFVRQIGGVLVTFLMAGILAYVLNPLVRRLERRIPRVVAVVGIFLILAVAVVTALLVLIIPAVGQVQRLVQNPAAAVDAVNALVERAQDLPYVGERIASLDQKAVTQFLQKNAPSAGQTLNVALGFIGGVFGVFGTILNLILMLIVSIYLLLDRERITRAVIGAIPDTIRDQAVELFHAVEDALIKYIRAQLTLCAIMGVIGWAIGQFAIGKYALLIGLWVGLTEIIPVLGAFLGAAVAILIALIVPDGGITTALIVAGLFLLAQQLEGNILVPRVMGGSVGVHPLWVLFATLAATALYGVVGAIFAVPIVAIIAATFRYLRGTLVFEEWGNAPIRPLAEGGDEKLPVGAPESESPSAAAGLGRSRRPDGSSIARGREKD
ncbi:MAG TPA: AI-2E family transporter [Rubrobacteraceae bacterium]|nr:AI-2E family transporter [Rubrobacteraceae bacterium]